MKILMVISTLNTGGAQKIVSQITTHLPQDWEIDILLNSSENVQFPYRGNLISLDLPRKKGGLGLWYQWRVFCKRLQTLKKLKKENGYKTCISFLDSANFANILTGNKYCETMVTINNNMTLSGRYEKEYRLIVNPLIKLLYNRADKISALCLDVLEDMVENFGLKREKMVSLYCSIDVEEIHQVVENFTLPSEDKPWFSKENTIVTAGRFVEQKGQWHLIRAFSRVHEKCPEAKLVVFGFGDLEPYFKELIKDYGLEQAVCLHPFSNQLVGYIASSAVYVMPSLYEGFGTALQEALACGTACVATDYVSGGREQLDPEFEGEIKEGFHQGKYGILVPECGEERPNASEPLDACEEAMAQALIKLLSEEDFRKEYANRTGERALAFDVNKIAKDWQKVIEANV